MQHPDEGTIHALLDGALPDAEARALEEHVASCAECSARVAEARGLVAGASRIVGALDGVPAGVVPSGRRAARAPGRAWWRRPGVGVAAAMAIVAVGTTMFVTRDWERAVPSAHESAAPMILRVPDSAARPDSSMIITSMDPESDVPVSVPRPAPARLMDSARPSLSAPREIRTAEDRQAGQASAARRRENDMTPAPPVSPPAGRVADAGFQDAAAAKVRTEVAGGSARERTVVMPDSIARAGRPLASNRVLATPQTESRAAEAAPDQREAERGRAPRMQPPIFGAQTLVATATDLAGCYTLSVPRPPDSTMLQLPGMVELAPVRREPAEPKREQLSQGFAGRERPLLVPPADDTARNGWHLAAHDSVAVRLTTDGRSVLLTFPTRVSEPRMGYATATAPVGMPPWGGLVIVRRIACP